MTISWCEMLVASQLLFPSEATAVICAYREPIGLQSEDSEARGQKCGSRY